jgi:hypothetical protein
MTCENISDEMVELYAWDKLSVLDQEAISHLRMCLACRERVDEVQQWVRHLKKSAERTSSR